MTRAGREKGFALLLALWSIALLAAAAGYGLHQSQARSKDHGLEVDLARAGMALQTGEALARHAIFQALEQGVDPTGRRRAVWDGFDVLITIESEAGKVNPNDASPEILAAVFETLGSSEVEAAEMSERIADFLDRDSQARPNGAEALEYARSGLLSPKNAAIRYPEELWGVLGFAAFINRLGAEADPARWMTLSTRTDEGHALDQAFGVRRRTPGSPDGALGPFRIVVSAKIPEDRAVKAKRTLLSRSATVIISTP